MEIAKHHVDVGLFTNSAAELLPLLATGSWPPLRGDAAHRRRRRQQRHGMNGSVFKLNDVRDPMPETAPSGYRELFIASAAWRSPKAS